MIVEPDWSTWLTARAAGPVRGTLGRWVGRIVARRWADGSTDPEVARRVVVVASPSFGGAGKTPVVALLAKNLAARGRSVAIVGHGYGGARRDLRRASQDPSADGDEAVALARALPDVPVFLGADRGAAALRALVDADAVVVDGGLGARGLPLHGAVLVEDATLPSGVFPAGFQRFDPADVPHPGLRWRHKVDEPGARAGDADVASVWRPRRLRAPDGAEVPLEALREGRWVALCGIARPGSFAATLEALGARVDAHRRVGDHRRFPEPWLDLPAGWHGVTTSKDAARLPPGHGLHVLEGEAVVVAGQAALDAFFAARGL